MKIYDNLEQLSFVHPVKSVQLMSTAGPTDDDATAELSVLLDVSIV